MVFLVIHIFLFPHLSIRFLGIRIRHLQVSGPRFTDTPFEGLFLALKEKFLQKELRNLSVLEAIP